MYLCEYNVSQVLELAKMKQMALLAETELHQQVRQATKTARRQRRFRLMYRVRHWLFRLAPRYAARLTL